tara:strand:- start:453 stop:887 length:435 start_codon:yes stop_codon:yes gene_type:complete
MTLVKWNPAPNIFDDVNDWFNQITNNIPVRTLDYSIFHPDFEIQESEKEFLIRAELPGMDKKDVNINIENDVLTISGERRESKKDENKTNLISEITYGSFSRSFTLPNDVLEEKIKAKMKNGVLELTVPRTEPVKTESKRIEIR